MYVEEPAGLRRVDSPSARDINHQGHKQEDPFDSGDRRTTVDRQSRRSSGVTIRRSWTHLPIFTFHQKFGVRANAVMPNAITRMANALAPEAVARLAETTALKDGNRPTFELTFHEQPHDVEAMVTYLASEQCAVTPRVYSGLGNRFARVFTGVTPGWHAPAGSVPTPETVAVHLAEIDNEEGYGVPRHLGEEIKHAQGIPL
jgi:hypothetical protein